MNQLCSSEVLLPEKGMRYKLRIISVHKGQGGGLKEQETKKKGKKRGRKDEAHYYGYLCNFVTHNETNLMTMMLMMWRKMICC